MESLYESIKNIFEASAGGGGPYNYIISHEKDYKATDDSSLDKYRNRSTGRREYVNMVLEMLGIAPDEDTRDASLIGRLKSIFKSETKGRTDEDIKKTYRTFVEFVEGAWQVWISDWDGAKERIPFRFNNSRKVKIAHAYDDYRVSMGWPKSLHTKRIGYITVIVGDGLGHGQGGLKFERDMLYAICQYMASGCQLSETDVFKDKAVESTIRRIHESQLRDILLGAAEGLEEDPSIKKLSGKALADALAERIKQTGGKDTKRHIADVFGDDTRKLDQKALYDGRKSALNISGKRISDITIFSPNAEKPEEREVYLSIKDTLAQLSGVVVSPSKNGVNWMDEILGLDEDADIQNPSGDEFKKFWSAMGLDPSAVRKAFKESERKRTSAEGPSETFIEFDKSPSDKMGEVIQWLIGGNYWYVSPKKVLYVPDEPKRLRFTIKNAYITAAGRCVNIAGDLSGVPMVLVIRTSDRTRKYPNRMFPKIDVEKLLELKGEEI